MSHFTRVKTSFKDAEVLVEALANVGISAGICEPTFVRDYQGHATENKATVIAKREQWGGARCADIGFTTGDNPESHVDGYNNQKIGACGGVDGFLAKVTQEYAVAKIAKQAKAKGKVAHRVAGEAGRVHVFVGA